MTKVTVDPGICGLISKVEATSVDEEEVTLKVESDCSSICKLMEEAGDTFDSFELCLKKPGEGPLYEHAKKILPGHASCPVIAGMIKAAEVECKLALPKQVTITFE